MHIPNLAVFALAKEDNTVLLVVIRSTRPWEFLVILMMPSVSPATSSALTYPQASKTYF